MLEALLVAQLDPAEIEHAVLHGGEHALTAAGAVALKERRDNTERKMQAGPESPICAPVTNGGPSRNPVVDAEPPAHWATFS